MNFFVPLTRTAEEREALYQAMQETLKQAGLQASEERIRRIQQFRRGEEIPLQVGRLHPESQEVILAIFHDPEAEAFYLFTPSQGVWEGEPIQVPGTQAVAPKPFADFNGE